MAIRFNIFSVFFLVFLFVLSCEKKSDFEEGDSGASEADGEQDQEDIPPIDDTGGRDEDKKTFIDYCDDASDDPDLQKTIAALKQIAGEELCGIVQGKISRTDPLDLSRLQLTDLRPLRGFTGIQTLILRGNLVSDVSDLTTMTGLKNIDLSSNPIADVSALKVLTRLESLNVSDTDLETLDSVAEITSLKTLLASLLFKLNSLQAISGLNKLETLDVSFAEITDLNDVSGLTSLSSLRVNSSKVANVSGAAGLSSLALVAGDNPERKGFEGTGTPLVLEPTLENVNPTTCPTDGASSAISAFCTSLRDIAEAAAAE